jgi:hypothetical protein
MKRSRSWPRPVAAAALAVLSASPGLATAAPTLIGDSVTFILREPGGTAALGLVAGTGEGSLGTAAGTFRPFFTDDSMSLGFLPAFPLRPFEAGTVLSLEDIDALVVGASLSAAFGDAGFVPGDLSFTANSVSLNLGGKVLAFETPYVLTLSLADPSALPEPATLALAMLGLGGIAASAVGRRRP